ncbi:MAG: type II secretion system GspH family protein [Proteobacteria bacterium]|nr:type II secretion system GspH family protein [Pseudomonadota bacterium]
MTGKNVRPNIRAKQGFSLIELMLVVVIIGVMVAVVLPRAWRARQDTKVNLVRQTASELGSWGMTWAQRNLESQNEGDSCNLDDYVFTLLGWTGQSASNNWGGSTYNPAQLTTCRSVSGNVTNTVAAIMPPDNQPRNPFNGVSYFNAPNDAAVSISPGQLQLARVVEAGTPNINQYYFVFLGPGSTTATDFYAGQGTATLAELRNGVFMARLAD